MNLHRGDTLGAYEIVAPIGAGGMGQVYRARDTKLGREVALKFVADDVAADPDRGARFEREARALAALNHPNIVGIFAIENDGTRAFLAMEYVQGDVLSDVIRKGGLALERLLTIATQIAAAVAAAHRQGVVHRDLKPANVVVAAGDRVKVLDFGLAKLRGESFGGAETQPTAEVITGEGKILGTVAYMSPEQAEGHAIDERSDIFSLGVILYEMATGERPFKGDSSISLLSSILRDTPKPLSDINPALPRELARIVRRCLAKNRDERYQSAADLRNDLEDMRQSAISGELMHAAVAVPTVSRAPRWPAIGIALAAGIAALAMAAWPRPDPGAPRLPGMQFSRLTLLPGVASEPSLSPDGKWVAYVTNGDIYLQSTTGETAINLTKDAAAIDRMPAFSPDGELIVFRSERDGGGLFVMGRTGESVRRISRQGYYPSWFPDGKRIAYATIAVNVPQSRGGGVSELWSVDINSGEPQLLFRGDAMQPRVSPNGRRIAYWAMPMDEQLLTFVNANRDLWTIGVDGTGAVRFTTEESTDAAPVWSRSGDALYFVSDRAGSMNLWRKGIDQDTGEPIGNAQPLTAPESYVRDFSLSGDGRLGTYANFSTTNNVSRVRFDARTATPQGPIEHLTYGPRDFNALDVNRDHEVVLMKSFTQQEDLLVVSAGSPSLRHLMKDPFRDRNPRWSPDGQKVYFYSDRGTHYELYSIDRDGGGLRRLTDTGGNRFYPVPSPDGTKVASSNIRTFDLYLYDATDFSKPPETLPKLPEAMRGGTFVVLDWSPDSRSIVGTSGAGVWMYSLDARSYRAIGRASGTSVQWLPDGRRLLFARQGRLYVRDLAADTEREIMSLPGEAIAAIGLSPDASYVYFTRGNQSGDIWLVRFEDGVTAAATAAR